MDPLTAVLVIILTALAALIQAVSGFGFSLFLVPLLAAVLGPKHTVFLANLLSVAINAAQVVTLREHVAWRTSGTFLAGAVAGMPFGLAVLLVLSPVVLQVVIACVVLAFTVLLARGLRLHDAGRPGDIATGLISGVLNTSTSMSGPPVVLYLQGKRFLPQQFRATATAYFLASALIAVGLLVLGGASKPYLFAAALISLPGLALGRIVGNRLFLRMRDAQFVRLVYAVLVLSAISAIITALAG